jgi:hypothetical protein
VAEDANAAGDREECNSFLQKRTHRREKTIPLDVEEVARLEMVELREAITFLRKRNQRKVGGME